MAEILKQDNDADADATSAVSRREALRKAAGIGAAAGVAFAAPAVNGVKLVPAFAAAASGDPVVVNGQASKSIGCFSGAGGNDQFLVDLPHPGVQQAGWWHFYFQGCSALNTESVALADPAGGPTGNAYQAPTNYRCKMQLSNNSFGSVAYDTGWVSDPINGIADTGGYIFIGTAAFPNGLGTNVQWRITCEPQP